jgi:hypothetical protein
VKRKRRKEKGKYISMGEYPKRDKKNIPKGIHPNFEKVKT